MDGGLRDEAVGEGEAEDTRDEARAAEEEEVPVEACGFFEREAAVLCREGGEVVVVVEEEHHEAANGEGDEDPFHRQVPEVDQPAAVYGGVESAGVGEAEEVDTLEVAGDVAEADPEDGRDRVGVVGQDLAETGAEHGRAADALEEVDGDGVEDGDHGGGEAVEGAVEVEADGDGLDAFDEVDGADVEGEGVGGIVGHGAHVVDEVH